MKSKSRPPGLFVTGTDTGVGKTRVAAAIARSLLKEGIQVGVYKPAASGCERVGRNLISQDAQLLWEAAGKPGTLARVCPQRFAAPLAPHLAAKEEGEHLDEQLLRTGLNYWLQRSDFILVEGAGGLLSPLGEKQYIADLALDFGFPLLVVAPNRIGVVNQTLQTLLAAQHFNLSVAGIVLNDLIAANADPSVRTNPRELALRSPVKVLARLSYNAPAFPRGVNWMKLGQQKQ